ncbi:MAG: hypothetical protein ACRCXM_08990 [Beijerinckiaceae bacterium]
MMPKLEEMMELGMDTVLAPVVAAGMGGIANLNGTFTMNGATPVVVANARLGAGDQVIFTLVTVGGTVGDPPSIKTRTNGTGFTVAGTAADTSVYAYRILKA